MSAPQTHRRSRPIYLTLLVWSVGLSACRSADPGSAGELPDTTRAVPAVTRHASDGIFSAVQAERGGVLYEAFCQECHQPDLSGAKGPPLTGADFLRHWGGSPTGVADLFGFITSLMPEYDPGLLRIEEYADVLAFILRENGFRPGPEELPPDIGRLQNIVIDSTRPAQDYTRR